MGVKKNRAAIKVCGLAAVINDPMPMIGIQAGAAALLPSPTKCQEETNEEIISKALAGATASAPPDNEPKRFLEYRSEINRVSKTPSNKGCLTKDRILVKLLLDWYWISSKLSSITPRSE